MHLIIMSPQEKNKLNLPNEYENDYHSSEHHLSSSKNKAWSIFRLCRYVNLQYSSEVLGPKFMQKGC